MEIEVSTKTTKICKSLGLSAEAMAFCDLVAIGWEPTDAYFIAFRKGMTWIKKTLKEEIEKILQSQAAKDRIDEIKGLLSSRQKDSYANAAKKERNQVIDTAMSKEQMLYDLQTAVTSMRKGSKEWLDTKKLIVDVTRMKNDEVTNEETTIHHFLPVRYPTGCQDCLFQRCDSCIYKISYDNAGK